MKRISNSSHTIRIVKYVGSIINGQQRIRNDKTDLPAPLVPTKSILEVVIESKSNSGKWRQRLNLREPNRYEMKPSKEVCVCIQNKSRWENKKDRLGVT